MSKLLFTLLLGSLFYWSCGVVPAEVSPSASHHNIAFTLTESNNISVPVVLNQTDTLPMMLHTAASGVTVISVVSEDLRSIAWNGADTTRSWGGANEARRSDGNIVSVGNVHRDSVTIWETTNSGPGTEGKFGLDHFAGQVVGINFSEGEIRLYPTRPDSLPGYEARDLRLDGSFMFITGEIPMGDSTYSQEFLIHSGYAGALLFDDAFTAEARLSTTLPITDQQELKDSYGNRILTQKATLPNFSLGGTSLSDLTVGFFSGDIGRQKVSVMGGEVIKRFDWIIDLEAKKAWIKYRG
ncbi:hypothetical protein [Lewinella sp. W8]|uniref:hypothetical protein n=1 Tax=Lewinella sp. W8 TaxID=2528208 RepID=UPI00106732D1|nr:hypothetical protein [Lewinella sp. W8]MTB51138.1 hypothetical protein [Lewinella sp. W8]